MNRNTDTPFFTPRRLAAAMTVAAIAGLATAQPPADETQLLRGPSVTDTHVPGASDAFAGRPMAGAAETRRADHPIALRAFVGSVRQLDEPGVDPALHLNDGQRAVIEVMLREHREAVEAWRSEHRDEIRELRGSSRKGDKHRGRRGAAAPARGERPARPGQPQDRRMSQGEPAQRLDGSVPPRGNRDERRHGPGNEQRKAQHKSLMATRPNPEPQQAQIWSTLTPEQRSFVEADLERRKADAIARRDMMKQRRQRAGGPADNADRGPRNRPAMRDGETINQFRQRMRKRIEQLPPEQRQRALERLNRATNENGVQKSPGNNNEI